MHHALNPNPYRGVFGNDGPAYARDMEDLIKAATPGESGRLGTQFVNIPATTVLQCPESGRLGRPLGDAGTRHAVCTANVPKGCRPEPSFARLRAILNCCACCTSLFPPAGRVAGFIHETIQGVGGAVPLADGYLPAAYKVSQTWPCCCPFLPCRRGKLHHSIMRACWLQPRSLCND